MTAVKCQVKEDLGCSDSHVTNAPSYSGCKGSRYGEVVYIRAEADITPFAAVVHSDICASIEAEDAAFVAACRPRLGQQLQDS